MVRPISQADGQITAIAHFRGMAVATRNIRDFEDTGIDTRSQIAQIANKNRVYWGFGVQMHADPSRNEPPGAGSAGSTAGSTAEQRPAEKRASGSRPPVNQSPKPNGISSYGLDTGTGIGDHTCMSLIEIFQRFPDHAACIAHMETVRWGANPACPHCGSVSVARKADGNRVGRWNCHDCKSSFNVLHGTIFQKTKIPLQKWFLAIGLLLNAKKSISSCQLARDLEINQKSAWFLAMRVRIEMAKDANAELLQGIVEADECYVGGKPRKGNQHGDDDSQPAKRGRGTDKMPVVGVVERGGRVVARPAAKSEISSAGLKRFILAHVDPAGSMLISDGLAAYNRVGSVMRHAVINHAERYVDGAVHTNTIEGFWSGLKRAWYGSHHHYSRKYAGLYINEQCASYNDRSSDDRFTPFLAGAVA